MTSKNDNQKKSLNEIHSPEDLRDLNAADLEGIAHQIREFLIHTISKTGGHLGASLGVVELTLALHFVFDTPDDRIIWDVGHQAYPHKILTGRRDQLHSTRQKNGLSGFPKRDESEYDTFGTGHSSTSISAALGMAIAARQERRERKSIAVIGDGAMTAGMAFEALNHAGSIRDLDLIVVLNDNDMSISPPVGAISTYLSRVLSSRFYNKMRSRSKSIMRHIPGLWKLARRWEEHMKGMILPGTLWEELGFNYIGPIDGHDLGILIETLSNMKRMIGPRFLHVVTQKGKGYKPAEDEPVTYHGVGSFDPVTGKIRKTSSERTFTQVFSDWICDAAKYDKRIHVITPAMREGSGLVRFSDEFPDRYHDVAIAEQHAITFAAGMACEGLKPLVAIYSSFLQRGYDQLIHDVALQNLDVTFAVDRAGVVGADGATHSGSFDISFSRIVPNLVVMTPSDESECRLLLQTALTYQGPAMVRYPRGGGSSAVEESELNTVEIGKAKRCRKGEKTAILNFGSLMPLATELADDLNATLVDMRFVKPIDEELLGVLADTHELFISLEDNVVQGGAGSVVAEWNNRQAQPVRLKQFGYPDAFIEQATRAEQLEIAGLTKDQILQQLGVEEVKGS